MSVFIAWIFCVCEINKLYVIRSTSECYFKLALIFVNDVLNLTDVQVPDGRAIDSHDLVGLLQSQPRRWAKLDLADLGQEVLLLGHIEAVVAQWSFAQTVGVACEFCHFCMFCSSACPAPLFIVVSWMVKYFKSSITRTDWLWMSQRGGDEL